MNDSPVQPSNDTPHWLTAIEEFADQALARGSSCEQVHPVIERWYNQLLQGSPPESRDSVIQAISCLASEVLYSSPENIVIPLVNQAGEDDVALWIEQILLIGRAFEIALQKGELDDL